MFLPEYKIEIFYCFCYVLSLIASPAYTQGNSEHPVRVEFRQQNEQIDVLTDDKLFTSYRFSNKLTKPILFPVCSPSGIVVNRMFPIENVAGETMDHPHHTGLFFTYDEVNGNDFWGATSAPPQILHKEIRQMQALQGKGILSTVSVWNDTNNISLLQERRVMTFYPGKNESIIDFDIELWAIQQVVTFKDTKEGMFAIRVAEWLKETDGTGHYLSSNGDVGENGVWGKRAQWVALEGIKDGGKIGIVIGHHPQSINFPTFWHARGYGLFSANPLGQSVFESSHGITNASPYNLTLKPGEGALFKFRLIIYEGPRTAKQIQQFFNDFQ
jgi:hypothetical protein